jgi:hypothetical protein
MPNAQRYVSSELSHFVGRDKSEEEQYSLLVKILRSGWLTHGPNHDPTVARTAGLDFSKPISTDEAIKYQVVCFCDIPENDLSIHVNKYSRFGLAFKKEFLIDAGACPVFYVANEGRVPAGAVFNPGDFMSRIQGANAKGGVDRALYFDTSVRGILDLLAALDSFCSNDGTEYFKGTVPRDEWKSRFCTLLGLNDAQAQAVEASLKGNFQAKQSLAICTDFLLNYVFSFVKCFDAKRPFEDEANYYMEREWRVANNVSFRIDDVVRVFFPASFAARFRSDLPAYKGQISFID